MPMLRNKHISLLKLVQSARDLAQAVSDLRRIEELYQLQFYLEQQPFRISPEHDQPFKTVKKERYNRVIDNNEMHTTQ